MLFEELSKILVCNRLRIHVDECRERRFPPVHEMIRCHFAVVPRRGVVRPLNVLEMVDPRLAEIGEAFAEAGDEGAVESLNVPLGLGTVGDAGAFLDAFHLSHGF